MSPDDARLAAGVIGFPRVSGDEPLCTLCVGNAARFSPRERG